MRDGFNETAPPTKCDQDWPKPTMKTRPSLLRILCLALLVTLLLALNAFALPDNLSLSVTNPWTKSPVTLNLQRYSLRATNYQVRIYSDVSTYTVLSPGQIPEVTTYRGRIVGDPGAFVAGAFKPNGSFYYNVSYGCRWQDAANHADPYDGTNRLSWSATIARLATIKEPRSASTNLPRRQVQATPSAASAAPAQPSSTPRPRT